MASPSAREWAERGTRAHAATFRMFTGADPRGKFREDRDATFFVTGFPANTFNGALVLGELADLDDMVRRTREFVTGARVPWSISLREDLADRLRSRMEGQGFRQIDHEPALALLSLDREAPPVPSGLELRRARTPEELAVFLITAMRGFGFPPGVMRPYLRPGVLKVLVQDPRTAWYVGFCDGRPVATSVRSQEGELSYVSMVSTVKGYRNRGFGAAMTWKAVLSGREAGCKVGLLRATKMGEPVYRKMGFVDVATYRTFASPRTGGLRRVRMLGYVLGILLWFAVRGRSLERAKWTTPVEPA